MLVIGKLLLLICTVKGAWSEPKHDLSGLENIFPELDRAYKNSNYPPLYEVLGSADPEEPEVRKVRDTDKDTTNPLQPKQINGANNKRRSYVESSLPEKIPVMVIYDPEPITQRDLNNGTIVKVKRRKQPTTPQPSNKASKSEIIPEENKVLPKVTEVVTENPTTSPSPRTVVPKTFTKRPPEFNPVFKKIRQRDPVVKIVEETNYVFSHSGNFHYSFEGADGTKVSSQGELKSYDNEKMGEAVVGSVFYKDNEGNDVSLSYTADEHGYRPHGAHLPTPPPIPPAIARALKYLATATTPEPVTKPTPK